MRTEIEKRLKGFYALKDGWNGPFSKAISHKAIRAIRNWLPVIIDAKPLPFICPVGSAGMVVGQVDTFGVNIEWEISMGFRVVEIEVYDDAVFMCVYDPADEFCRVWYYPDGFSLHLVEKVRKWIDWAYEDPSNVI
jgi:hypothetical protein